MLCFLTHRRIKPGTFEQFRAAWQPDNIERFDELGIMERIYHARSLENPDEIVSFGLADIGLDDLPRLREALGGEDGEKRRQQAMSPYVLWTGVDAVFEVVEEIRVGG